MIMMMMLSTKILTIFLAIFVNYISGQKDCDAIIDLTLLVDSSGSITPDDFETAKGALIDIVSRLNVDVKKANVAVINYASNVSLDAQQNVFGDDKQQVLEKIAGLPRLGSYTATGDALELAKLYCQGGCRSVEEGIPRIFVIFTDGHSNTGREVPPVAQAIREAPMAGTLFAVGIGNIGAEGDKELLEIAGDKEYVMNIKSYQELLRVTNVITTQICEFPAFILPDMNKVSNVRKNNVRYYKMDTLSKTKKNAFFEIELRDKVGQASVYTSTSNKKPTSATTRSILRRSATGGKVYTTYVPANAKNFYFAVKGIKEDINEYDFVVRVRPLDY